MDTPSRPCIAILDTSPDFIDMLKEIMEIEEFDTISEYILNFRTGRSDIHSFFAMHKPNAVIYDVALPYQENWQFLKHVLEISGLRSCQFIVVTTNKRALDALVGETGGLEILGKPMDLDALIQAVNDSLANCR